jgi:hypothetical protein
MKSQLFLDWEEDHPRPRAHCEVGKNSVSSRIGRPLGPEHREQREEVKGEASRTGRNRSSSSTEVPQ